VKREAVAYEAALRAFRAATEEPADGAAARACVLASAARRAARDAALRRVCSVAALALLVVVSGSAAWTAMGRWRAEVPKAIETAESARSARTVVRGGGDRPARVLPAAAAVTEQPPSAVGRTGESAAYARAHRAHFVEDAPARALAAWDAYLASHPAGAFAPEAAYNRALCLVRLGRFVEASVALRPFARGRFGAYRHEEATLLLDWMARAARSNEDTARAGDRVRQLPR
jgi:hypothetical protein